MKIENLCLINYASSCHIMNDLYLIYQKWYAIIF